MKKLSGLLIILFAIFLASQILLVSCTNVDGDGIDSIYYNGSNLPQNASYRNPVWEPDFELGTVFKGPNSFTAIASETQWAQGLTYCGPIITSANLMDWGMYTNTAFPLTIDTLVSGTDTIIYKKPQWAKGRIHSMSAGFTRTVPSTSYWLFYQIGNEPAIGVAAGRSAQGPYSDFGKLIDTSYTGSKTISAPFFYIKGTLTYLLFSTENGSYIQQLTIKRNQMPALVGAPVQISGNLFTNVALFAIDDYFYIFGTVATGDITKIHYGRANSITGPYLGADGNSLINSTGTLLVDNGTQLNNPGNVCGIFTDLSNSCFILYNVTDIAKPLLTSGYNRRPLMLNNIQFNDNGWVNGVIKPEIGWVSPKFIDKE